jgi:hypothetical protein
MKYKKFYPDANGWSEWEQPVMKGYKMACCDCGLVHVLNFKVSGRTVQFRARRDNRATGQVRRHKLAGS